MTTITIGNRGGETFSGMQDSLLVTGDSGNYSTNSASAEWPAFLLRPDLSGIPSGSTITDAFWTLGVSAGGSASGTVVVQRLLRAWVETQATWFNWSTGNAWTTAGAGSDGNDRSATTSCSFSYPGGFSTSDVVSTSNTQLITDIQNMVNGSVSTNGWRFDVSLASFGLPAHGTAAKRPFLTVTYSAAGGGRLIGSRLVESALLNGLIR